MLARNDRRMESHVKPAKRKRSEGSFDGDENGM